MTFQSAFQPPSNRVPKWVPNPLPTPFQPPVPIYPHTPMGLEPPLGAGFTPAKRVA